ncbi:MAG: hypothetical protein CL858_04660 [Cupriavidus sp.]|jgi:hypothetical protein|uniref:Uncharacterized protein n=1 Tax=Sphingomonas corticis TaxID=2722791 RepID=A0ABX1CRF2_9SPHN|nr:MULTISPECIES: hypothetical protein [Sphingomonadaceae]MBU64744.1 hypothetical protein [Cupriavidus sp.]MBS89794.1 hypothetical protein [Sphingobium sp.]MCP4028380.1 hypothetical protein [Sphingomonas sp.]NJR80519.1 hypothetical protein [Sphingomonas corticis]RSU73933.1 hypothetical protein DAH54_21575 [Sphingomonas koreensis]|tara:strand:- start:738 stop:1196 length:459 start_codon:yes stop_codon:yes gene_type:complete
MNDHVLLHRGDLESARLSRDHADAMRRFVTDLRPLARALRSADGRAYDPSGVIPDVRAAVEECIVCHERTASDLDGRALAYERNAASRTASARKMSSAELILGLAHRILLCAGAAALMVLAWHAVEKVRSHLLGPTITTPSIGTPRTPEASS